MSDFELNAEVRDDMGKGASRRLRRLADQIPAILYGGDKPPQPLQFVRKDLEHALENEAFYSHVLTLQVGKSKEKAILKDLQRHPAKDRVMHADFLRVSDDVAIKVNVPLHFLNEDTCFGVKMEGGMIQHLANEIEVLCLPGDMPEYIEVDMAEVKVGEIIHLSDVTLPKGVESVALSHGADHDLSVASVLAPKGGGDEEEELEAAAAEAESEEAPAGDQPADDAGTEEDSDS
ncbi:MAG: 50S ribosomal protein L25/general stress protein Ctc [Halieaceae bacterium]|nr:50S ribosomal protein L25/general stress protein Ctc [Halieaceae bacterium]